LPVTSSLFRPNILLSTLFSNTLNLCFSLNVRDQVSHPYRTFVTILQKITFIQHRQRTSVDEGLWSRLRLNLFNHSETAFSHLKSRRLWLPPSLSLLYFLYMASPCPVARTFGFR
jgi:hypothetical protein